jgi:hypothetical protein
VAGEAGTGPVLPGLAAMSKKILPKRIVGVRVPKRLRRGPAAEALASRFGQALLEDLIVGLVGLVVAQSGDKDSPLRKGVRRGGRKSRRLRRASRAAAHSFMDALRRAPRLRSRPSACD